MSEHRILSFKPQLRLEWQTQDGQSETEHPDHSASLSDSITSSTRIRFSIHTAHKVFCAGLDLDLVRGKPAIETKKFLEKLYFALNDMQYRMGKPTIAAIDGAVRAPAA